ncbi:MAG: hypothetical protein NVSMB32_07250 [Actinomycetota bacterium]
MAAGLWPGARGLLIVSGTTAVIYLFLVVMLRIFGRRQLGQLTVIDVMVVLLLGSAVETAMIHGDVSLQAGLVSAATLLVINKLVTVTLLRLPRFRHLVSGGPVLLVHDGHLIDEHLRRVGMTATDLEEALRARGYDSPGEVRAAVLETDGTVSVIALPAPAEDKPEQAATDEDGPTRSGS